MTDSTTPEAPTTEAVAEAQPPVASEPSGPAVPSDPTAPAKQPKGAPPLSTAEKMEMARAERAERAAASPHGVATPTSAAVQPTSAPPAGKFAVLGPQRGGTMYCPPNDRVVQCQPNGLIMGLSAKERDALLAQGPKFKEVDLKKLAAAARKAR